MMQKDCKQELRDTILKENAREHDKLAELHDSVCSYIARKKCAEFYENLILDKSKISREEIPKLTVLELGCGTSTWAELFKRAEKYTGIDISPGMIDIARRKFDQPNIDFKCTDVETFLRRQIEKEQKYDLVLSSSFLHHLHDIDKVLNLIFQVLSENGLYLAIHEPYRYFNTNKTIKNIGNSIDAYFYYLLGYDIDRQQHPVHKRIAYSVFRLLPFKSLIVRVKRVFSRATAQTTSVSEVVSGNENIDYVDYKLSAGQTFHPMIFTNKAYQGIKVEFDLYSYYVFNCFRELFGEQFNYFYVKFTRE